ncbi:MAG: YceI family protein [Sphingomonadales bacterium]|nr:YceI family protein [Sphingomonadales bacterium]
MSMVRPWWHPCLALVILLGATASAPPAYRYRLDAPGSQVSARVAYFGVGHKTVRFPVMRGALRLVPERTEAIDLDVELDARALDAGGKTDSDYLKGKAFFDVANHPVVRFSGNRMTMTGETTARVDGRITARGVTRPAVLTVTFAQPPARASGRDPIALTATTAINRRDFGMTSYGLIVGKTVKITIRARLVPD